MSRLAALLFLLSFLVPLAALLLVSVGLIVLKRRSGRSPLITRLTMPPFYLVSLPIATLIVGAEMLGWYALLLRALLSPDGSFSWEFFFEHLFNWMLASLLAPFFSFDFWNAFVGPANIALLVGFWAATFASGYLLWQTVWREDHHQPSLHIARRLLRVLLLLICFAWAFCYLVSYIAELITPWGPWG
jgi:hypothetical protein